jgi:phage tail-like protein
MPERPKDPYLSYRFKVEISSVQAGGFNEVSGLTFENEVETFREGGRNDHDWQLAGPAKFPRLVLKRGVADVDDMWKWYLKVRSGVIRRQQVKIVLMDTEGNEKRGWIFSRACPVKWTGPTLQAGTNQVAFETVELVHAGVQTVY